MSCAIKARILGRVQGVFFRSSAQTEAIKLGITGWVKNTGDGDVCVEAEGDEKSLEQFLAWLHKGPKSALVEQVIIENQEASGAFHGFDIRN